MYCNLLTEVRPEMTEWLTKLQRVKFYKNWKLLYNYAFGLTNSDVGNIPSVFLYIGLADFEIHISCITFDIQTLLVSILSFVLQNSWCFFLYSQLGGTWANFTQSFKLFIISQLSVFQTLQQYSGKMCFSLFFFFKISIFAFKELYLSLSLCKYILLFICSKHANVCRTLYRYFVYFLYNLSAEDQIAKLEMFAKEFYVCLSLR